MSQSVIIPCAYSDHRFIRLRRVTIHGLQAELLTSFFGEFFQVENKKNKGNDDNDDGNDTESRDLVAAKNHNDIKQQ